MPKITSFSSLLASFKDHLSSPSTRKAAIFRIFIVFAAIFFIKFCSKMLNSLLPQPSSCIEDQLFNVSKEVNGFFLENTNARDYLLILSSGLMDAVILGLMSTYVIYGKTLRFLLIYMQVYALRGIIQIMYKMPFPDGYNWAFPGIYSFTIPYFKTNDFFFSGHTAFGVIAIMEFGKKKMKKWRNLAIVTLSLQIFSLIATRGHYSIDFYAGGIFAVAAYHSAQYLSDQLNDMYKSFTTNQQEEKSSINFIVKKFHHLNHSY